MATVGDLFDELYGSQRSDSPDAADNITITELIKCDPAQVIEYDRSNENSIHSDTEILKDCLNACEDIVVAAYRLREFVPIMCNKNTEQTKFWKESVIPNLLKVLTQDVKARSILIHAFGAVRDLGIVIQKASEIVRETKGSPKAIEIAKKNIPAALEKLDEFINKAGELDDSAINAFSCDAAQLFDIVGPEAVKFVKRKAEVEIQLSQLYERQNKLWDEYVESKAEATSYLYLINATEKRLTNEKVASEATKLRIEELRQMNVCTELQLQGVSELADSVTTKSRRSYWFWRQNKQTVTIEKSPNDEREEHKKYYESLIVARMARIRDEQTNDEANNTKLKELVEVLAEYRRKYEMAMKKMENFNETAPQRMDAIKTQIENLYKTLDQLEEEQIAVQNKIGLEGNTLIECLVNVQSYSRRIKSGANAYSPLVSILNGIKSLVQADVDLLGGSNIDIFIAGNRLTKLVGFISGYSASNRTMLELPNEYRQLTIAEN